MGAMKELLFDLTEELLKEGLKRNPDAIARTMRRDKCDEHTALESLRTEVEITLTDCPECDGFFDEPWVVEWIEKHVKPRERETLTKIYARFGKK